MKSNSKKIIILIVLVIGFVFLPNNKSDLSDVQKLSVINPKESESFFETNIYIDATATGVDAHNWTWAVSQSWCDGDGSWTTPYIIENVTIDANGSPTGSGILINNSKNEYFIIRNCTIFNADDLFFDSGIWLENTNNGTIINNNCSDNHMGIYLINCEGNNITENTANNNGYNGIYLDTNCVHNSIMGNIAVNNMFGIQLVTNCDYNNITLNTVTNNDDYGIYINSFGTSCDNNIILNNTVNENNRYGIYLRYDNNENSIINNSVIENIGSGIFLSACHNINVTGNYIYSNIRGIYISSCDNSIITGNTLNNNLEVGIHLIANSNDNEIKNNTINRNDLGIKLDNSDYNNVTGNTLKDNNWCIYETYCEGNIIEFNDCTTPTVELPIYIDDYATGMDAHNWTWAENQPWCSGSGTWEDPYVIENLKISGFGTEKYGIDIRNSNVSFIIQESLIYNSNDAGIYFDNVNNSRIINNNCSNNDNGIYVEYSNNITIFGNIANDNMNDGIFGYESNYVNITGNIVNKNKDDGIYISICDFSCIVDNIANGNSENGIYLEECLNNTITNNDCSNNNEGINLYYSDFNDFTGNVANNNNEGIYLHYSDFNDFTGNIANNNNYHGISLEESIKSTLTRNILKNNTQYGIEVDTDSNNNSIYENFFLENGVHAFDDGTDNKWNSTTVGNYWDNWTSPDTSPQDGIVDTPYIYISGSAGSIDYLPIAEDGAPRIAVISPTGGSTFSANAPSFIVEIVDDFLNEMWYTLDDGLHNYTFTEFTGTINQSAWDALSEGTITLTFYASDIAGNVALKEVTIIKDLSVGLDPGVIAVIVVLSIIGGLAIIGVILGILVKKGKISLEKLKSFSFRKK